MINKVVLVGRLVRDPELKKSPGGYSICHFTIACDRKGSKQNKQADFINCIVWRQGADFLTQYGAKGLLIGVTGSIHTHSYTDNSGRTVYVTEVLCEEIRLLEYKDKKQAPKKQEQPKQNSYDEAMQQWQAMDNDYVNAMSHDDFKDQNDFDKLLKSLPF
ncbi:single-stranded DNA-binding protein [Holdemania massiliensis]|uniref:single-stranded DNA-binding protein n=1 Tax=Holdemania massiliensis TaxID=1468449 RepID=UPI00242FDEED|nr:single-stranded DNA-binding protein [Holdemania massiliensis]